MEVNYAEPANFNDGLAAAQLAHDGMSFYALQRIHVSVAPVKQQNDGSNGQKAQTSSSENGKLSMVKLAQNMPANRASDARPVQSTSTPANSKPNLMRAGNEATNTPTETTHEQQAVAIIDGVEARGNPDSAKPNLKALK